jgi:hypothetical protein
MTAYAQEPRWRQLVRNQQNRRLTQELTELIREGLLTAEEEQWVIERAEDEIVRLSEKLDNDILELEALERQERARREEQARREAAAPNYSFKSMTRPAPARDTRGCHCTCDDCKTLRVWRTDRRR